MAVPPFHPGIFSKKGVSRATARVHRAMSERRDRATVDACHESRTRQFGGAPDHTAPNILAVAGGTGVSFAVPAVAAALENQGAISRV